MRRATLAIAFLPGLVGCAGMPAGDESAGAQRCDDTRMAAVEHAALRRGTELHWINCPQAPRAAGEREP